MAGGIDRAVAEDDHRAHRSQRVQAPAGGARPEDHVQGVRRRPALSDRGALRRDPADRAGGRHVRAAGVMPAPVSPRVDLGALASRLPSPPVTRFAPSPTGLLHLGHLVNAIYAWGLARALGGPVQLRIEDHDRSRSRPEFESGILRRSGVARLCRRRAAGAAVRSPGAPCRPRSRRSATAASSTGATALDSGLARIAAPSAASCVTRGRCRDRRLGPGGDRGVRVRLDDTEEQFNDGRIGPQLQQTPAQCGDLLITDRHGHWTYQFAVTVDDMQSTASMLVVRGDGSAAVDGTADRAGAAARACTNRRCSCTTRSSSGVGRRN